MTLIIIYEAYHVNKLLKESFTTYEKGIKLADLKSFLNRTLNPPEFLGGDHTWQMPYQEGN